MCRLLMYIFKDMSSAWNKIFNSFYLASTNDILLERISGKRSHNHGWGFVIYRFREGKSSISYYRSSIPINDDMEGLGLLKACGILKSKVQALIVHSRLTSEKEVKNVENSHPYMEHVPGRFTLWLAHNGKVSKLSIARSIGLEKHINDYSDTYFLTKYLAKKLPQTPDKHMIGTVLREIIIRGYVLSALNIAVLVVLNDERTYCFALNYVSPEVSDREEYYKLYLVTLNDEEKIVASSTFIRYFHEGKDVRALKNGDMVFFQINNGKLSFSLENIFKT